MKGGTGLASAVAQSGVVGASRERFAADAERGRQGELLTDDQRLDQAMPVAPGPAARGVGRPKGALNKSTAALRDYIVSRYGHPLDALAALAFQPVADLARELRQAAATAQIAGGFDVLDLVRLQIDALKELAPYVASKAPVEVNVNPNMAPALIVQTFAVTPGAGPASGAPMIDMGAMMATRGGATADGKDEGSQ